MASIDGDHLQRQRSFLYVSAAGADGVVSVWKGDGMVGVLLTERVCWGVLLTERGIQPRGTSLTGESAPLILSLI